jgi:hypothetical protein
MGKLKKIVDKYFLNPENPYSEIRTYNFKKLTACVFLVIGFAVWVDNAFFQKDARTSQTEIKKENEFTSVIFENYQTSADNAGSGYLPSLTAPLSLEQTARTANKPKRPISSSSSIVLSSQAGRKIPAAMMAAAHLINTVLSNDTDSPVIAVIDEDIAWRNAVVIPSGTKVLGQGSLQVRTHRLRTRFNSFVFPDGSQHRTSLMAFMPDNSPGLTGIFHTGVLQKNAGRALGTFVGGLADGMKERNETPFGYVQDRGGIKNGLLNGITETSLDQARETAGDIKQVDAVLEVPAGTQFLIFFEQEFTP